MSKILKRLNDNQNKVADTNGIMKLQAWDYGVAQDLTNKQITATVANDSGFLFDIDLVSNGTEIDLDFKDSQLQKLTPDTYFLEIKVTDEAGDISVFPTEGYATFTINKNLHATEGELVPQITFDTVLADVKTAMDKKVADYVKTIAKGDTGPAGKDGKDGKDADMPVIGGRNYILNSSGMNATGTLRPTLIGNVSDVSDDASISYTPESIVIKNKASSTKYGWYYGVSQNGGIPTNNLIVPGQTYTLSLKVRGNMSQVALRWGSTVGTPSNTVKYYSISDKWTKIYTTLTFPEGAQDNFIRIMGAVDNNYLIGFTGNESFEFKEVKLEEGNIATDWTPAPEDVPSNDEQLVHKTGDETIAGDKTFTGPIKGYFDWFNKNNYDNMSSQFKVTSEKASPVNLMRIKNLPVVTDALQFQESIIDPRSGYTYLFTNSYYALDSEGKGDLENLYIYEFDQFMRLRSTMRVNHGVDRKTWLHGQFEQFNYYNQNESKVEFLIGNYGQSLKLEYVPNTIVNADDLPVFLTVNETSSHNQAINFDDNKVYAMKGQGKSTDKTYTYDYYEYLLDPQTGKTTFNKQYTINVNTDKGIVHQGLSAAPASSYTNGEHQGTLLFNTSGYTVGTKANELSVRIFLIEDGEISEYADVFNLDQSGFLSTSQHRRTDIISSRKDGIMIYKELEGSSQTKINGSWVFTTLICYDANSNNSPDQPDLPISNRYKGQALLAWSGNQQSLLKTANIGKYQPNTMGLDYDVTDLSAIVYPGHYTLGAKQLPLYTDVPIILSGKDVKTVIGGTGIEEATLDVKVVDSSQRIKQTLNIYTYSVTGQETLTFTRYIRRNMTVGKPDKLTASTWHFEPLNIIGKSNLWPAIKTADDALLPGYQQYIKADKIADFFKSATNAPTDEGVFETSLLCVETSNTAKLLQRFATLPDLNRYERVVEVNVATSTVFPHGIGGGYSSVKNVGGWVKD